MNCDVEHKSVSEDSSERSSRMRITFILFFLAALRMASGALDVETQWVVETAQELQAASDQSALGSSLGDSMGPVYVSAGLPATLRSVASVQVDVILPSSSSPPKSTPSPGSPSPPPPPGSGKETTTTGDNGNDTLTVVALVLVSGVAVIAVVWCAFQWGQNRVVRVGATGRYEIPVKMERPTPSAVPAAVPIPQGAPACPAPPYPAPAPTAPPYPAPLPSSAPSYYVDPSSSASLPSAPPYSALPPPTGLVPFSLPPPQLPPGYRDPSKPLMFKIPESMRCKIAEAFKKGK